MMNSVIFDMDGVIVDTEPIYKSVNDGVYAKYGLDFKEEDLEKYIGVSLRETWKDIMENNKLNGDYKIDDIIEDHIYSYYQGLESASELELMPGVEEVFKFLKENDFKMVIASSSHEPIVKYIYQRFELGRYMQGFVDGTAVENGKPAPDIFLKALEKLGTNLENCFVVEDSEHGVNGAKKAGLKVIGFEQRQNADQDLSSADLIIPDFSQESLDKIKKFID